MKNLKLADLIESPSPVIHSMPEFISVDSGLLGKLQAKHALLIDEVENWEEKFQVQFFKKLKRDLLDSIENLSMTSARKSYLMHYAQKEHELPTLMELIDEINEAQILSEPNALEVIDLISLKKENSRIALEILTLNHSSSPSQ